MGLFEMRPLVSLLAIGLLGLGVVACGGAGKSARQASTARQASAAPQASTAQATVASAPAATAFHFGIAHGVRGLLGDGEDDEKETKTMGTVLEGDSDTDTDNDVADNATKGYYDGDDAVISAFGRAASAGERRAILAVLKRYYEAAVAGDGVKACSLTAPEFVKSIPEDYGSVFYNQAAGPTYLRGAATCSTVLERLFKHERAQLTTTLLVTAVRISGGEARVLLGSRTTPASYETLRRIGGVWKIAGLLSVSLL